MHVALADMLYSCRCGQTGHESRVFLSSNQPKLPLLLSRMKEVAKVFLATNSDYKYTEARFQTGSLAVVAVELTRFHLLSH